MRICPACGEENPERARFCLACATPLDAEPAPGRMERKFATALFADLVGSTTLAEQEDPEVVQSVVGRTFDRLSEEITRYGGHLEKFMGDAVLAVFGIPKTHEDDPERAVRAALEMQAVLSELNRTFAGEGKPQLAMRIGIEAGEVLVDLQRTTGPHDRMLTGDAVNTAARLQTAADPGHVVIGPAVFAAVKDVFDLGERTWAFVLGDVSGKGAEAATVSAATRYTLRALAAAQSLPSDTVRKVNTSLLSHTDVERHCTLVYGQLRPDPEGTTVVFTLAGHHPPIVLRRTGEVEEVGTLGTALALFDEPDLHDTTVRLAPGDLLCIFTDGLVEARRGREMFGGERVAALLNRGVDRPAAELSALLVDAVHDFHGDQLDDDLAVLVVKNAGRQPPSPLAMTSARCGPEVLASQQCPSS